MSPIRLGAFEIHRIVEMEMPFLTVDEMFPASTRAEVDAMLPELQPWCVDDERRILVTIQSYLVRTPDEVILLDTCVGCHKTNQRFDFWHQRTDEAWLERLGEAGFSPEDVTVVLCSHLHTDHAGWNTRFDGTRWKPTFPHARYIFSKTEVQAAMSREPEVYRESVLPVIEAGQAHLVELGSPDRTTDSVLVGSGARIAEGVWLEPTPGHTEGHCAIWLESEGERAVMWGDLCHSPAQCMRPDWNYRRDWDPDQSTASRLHVLDTCAGHGHQVLSSHFPSPSVGRIRREGQAFRFGYDKIGDA